MSRSRPHGSARIAAALALALVAPGCDGAADAGAGATTQRVASAVLARSSDPRLAQARAALQDGRLDAARVLAEQIGASAGVEGPLLAARVAQRTGDLVGALRLVEDARRASPGDPRVYATAAEVYAWDGRKQTAQEEIDRGVRVAGDAPPLDRARAAVYLAVPGGAAGALEHLARAIAADPDLPYVHELRVQAHVLRGREMLGAADAVGAAEQATLGLELAPADLDLRQLRGDALAAAGHFERACDVFEGLLAEGLAVEGTLATLHQRAATAALIERGRDAALAHVFRARELGTPTDQLGFGRDLLVQCALDALDAGIALYEADDLAGARERFERALELDPDSLEARDRLGVVLYRQERYGAAALAWQELLTEAERQGRALPRPVHLSLARALALAGRPDEASTLLEGWLERDPESEWAADTRALLDDLSRG